VTAYSEADAEAGLARLIDLALCGEEVIIMRGGMPVAEILPIQAAQLIEGPTSYNLLRARRLARNGVGLTSVGLPNQLYEEGR